MIIVIPAYNPDFHLLEVIKDMKKLNYPIILVNDGSDNSNYFNKVKSNVILLNHKVNKGKGAAMKTALEYAKTMKADGIIFVDADGQHKLKDVEKLINLFKKNTDSYILGYRTFYKKVPLRSKIGNNITRFMFKLFTHHKIKDTQTGLRVVPFNDIDFLLKIDGNRYEYEMNMLIEIVKSKKYIEEEIETIYIDDKNSTSHFKVIRDSFLIYKILFKSLKR